MLRLRFDISYYLCAKALAWNLHERGKLMKLSNICRLFIGRRGDKRTPSAFFQRLLLKEKEKKESQNQLYQMLLNRNEYIECAHNFQKLPPILTKRVRISFPRVENQFTFLVPRSLGADIKLCTKFTGISSNFYWVWEYLRPSRKSHIFAFPTWEKNKNSRKSNHEMGLLLLVIFPFHLTSSVLPSPIPLLSIPYLSKRETKKRNHSSPAPVLLNPDRS